MATVYERVLPLGNVWTLQWSVRGKRFTRSLGCVSPQEAEKALLQHKLDVLNEKPAEAVVPFLEDYIERVYLRSHELLNTKRTHQRVKAILNNLIIPAFRIYRLNELTLDSVSRYQEKQLAERNVKRVSINKEIVTLKSVLNLAVKARLITFNPIKHAGMLPENDSKEVGYFTEKELKQIYAKSYKPYRWKFLANTGLRLGEAKQLRWRHIAENHINVESTEAERTKSSRWRMVPLGKKTRSALLELWREVKGHENDKKYGDSDGYVFHTARTTLSQAATRAIAEAGLVGSAHKFRHTYISLLVMNDVSKIKLQKLAGHARAETTERYMHLAPEYLSDVAKYC